MSQVNRRQWIQAMGLLGSSASGWLPLLASELSGRDKPRRHCILLWMTGGPSQTDTFDMKPGHANGGEFKEIATNSPGIRISEHLPGLAKHADKLAIVRSLSTKEGDHGRGTYLMRTGHPPMGPIQYPTIGASLSKQMGEPSDAVPNFVSISPYRAFNQSAFGPGFLGPRHAPLTVGATENFQPTEQDDSGYAQLRVDDLQPAMGVGTQQFRNRVDLWRSFQKQFLATHRSESPRAHNTVYERALRLMNSAAAQAFDLSVESDKTRDAYGRGRFGQGCLMARRLIEQGVSFVEVSLGDFIGGSAGWDTHRNNFTAVKQLSEQLDAGWSMLMSELAERGLLERTTILWMGEFGRTPKINSNGGRDHFPAAWSCVLGGAGIQSGHVYGKTSADGTEVVDHKVDVGNILTTLCAALGIDPETQNISELGRPIRIAEGEPIAELLT